jgi:putative peptide zinc metalloprotease protein
VKRLLILGLSTALALGLAGFRPDAALANGDTAAVAVNTKDGSSIFRLAFAIKRAAGDVVDNGNAAVAFASCTDCRTVAISIQVVLITGDPEVVTPQNIAIAMNVNCTLCETFASAFQYVLTTDGQVHFSPDGNREIAEIRRELHALRNEELPLDQLQARIHSLMVRLADVIRTELEPAGRSDEQPPQTTTTTPTETTPTETIPTDTTPTTTGTTTEPTTTGP